MRLWRTRSATTSQVADGFENFFGLDGAVELGAGVAVGIEDNAGWLTCDAKLLP